jgi:hypothetical protein
VIRSVTAVPRGAAALVVVLAAGVFAACGGNTSTTPAAPASPVTTSGSAQSLGSGTASTFVTTDPSGAPTAIGFRLSQSALSNLPATDTEIDLPLPPAASDTAFKDLAIDWNPHGHPPPGIYDVPHFDFHFYMVDAATRATISPNDPSALASPPPDQIPTGYVPLAPQVVPDMGVHWIDPASAEFHGTPFTATFIYGFYDAKMTFIEPMVTLAFLQTNSSFSKPIALPQTYPYAGKYYPTSYSVSYDASTASYTVALTGLVKR